MIGAAGTTEVLADIFMRDSEYAIEAFCVNKEYIKSKFFMGLPVVAIEDVENIFPPAEYFFFVGLGGARLNALRSHFFLSMLSKEYSPATFISSKASVSPRASIGKHCCILENVVIHAGCVLHENVIVFPNCYLGHHTTIGKNCFIGANTTLAGGVALGESCFVGASSSISNCVKVGNQNVLGMGTVCAHDTADNIVVKGNPATYTENAETVFLNWHSRQAKKFRASQQNNF